MVVAAVVGTIKGFLFASIMIIKSILEDNIYNQRDLS